MTTTTDTQRTNDHGVINKDYWSWKMKLTSKSYPTIGLSFASFGGSTIKYVASYHAMTNTGGVSIPLTFEGEHFDDLSEGILQQLRYIYSSLKANGAKPGALKKVIGVAESIKEDKQWIESNFAHHLPDGEILPPAIKDIAEASDNISIVSVPKENLDTLPEKQEAELADKDVEQELEAMSDTELPYDKDIIGKMITCTTSSFKQLVEGKEYSCSDFKQVTLGKKVYDQVGIIVSGSTMYFQAENFNLTT